MPVQPPRTTSPTLFLNGHPCAFPQTTFYRCHARTKPIPGPPFSFWYCCLASGYLGLISSTGTHKLYRKQEKHTKYVGLISQYYQERTELASLCWKFPCVSWPLPHTHSSSFPFTSKHHFPLFSRFLCQPKDRLPLLRHLPNVEWNTFCLQFKLRLCRQWRTAFIFFWDFMGPCKP